MENSQLETKQKELPKVTQDQEVWIKNQVETAIRMALALKRSCRVGADEPAYESAIKGVINGCAWEVIRIVGMQPSYINMTYPFNDLQRSEEPIGLAAS